MAKNEECIGEYEMHPECRLCEIQSSCKKKFNKLMAKYKEYLLKELPQRAKAKDYVELQQLEAKRQRIADQIKKLNEIKKEQHKVAYNLKIEKNKFFGVKEE